MYVQFTPCAQDGKKVKILFKGKNQCKLMLLFAKSNFVN